MTRAGQSPNGVSTKRTCPTDALSAVTAFLGDLRGRTVLDFGCAEHRVAEHVTTSGGRYLGVAADERLRLAAASAAETDPDDVRVADIDRWSGHDAGVYDVVVSVLAPQYVSNLARLLETLHHHVVSGGRLVFAVDHPFATAEPDGYFQDGPRPAAPQWTGRTANHRCFEAYLRELRYCGFRLTEFAEGPAGGTGPLWAVFRCTRTP
jgi:SAM-dependent methyltransferase